MKTFAWKPWATALLALASLATFAQDPGKVARDLALNQGADRHDKLVELA